MRDGRRRMVNMSKIITDLKEEDPLMTGRSP